MEKQEAIDFVTGELDKGRSPADISAALSRKLNAPVDLVSKFVCQTQQRYAQLKAAQGTPDAARPQPLTGSEQLSVTNQQQQTALLQQRAAYSQQRTALIQQRLANSRQPVAISQTLSVGSRQPTARSARPRTASMPAPTATSKKLMAVSLSPAARRLSQARTRKSFHLTLGKNVSIRLGALIVGLFFFTALAAPLLAPPDPGVDFSTFKGIGQLNRYIPFQPKAGLLLGSVPDPANQRQLDIWYSLVWGTRSALIFGLLVVLLTGAFGVILGGASAYLGGLSNTLIMGFTDAFLAFPLIAGVIFFQQFILMLLSRTGIMIYWNGMLPAMESPTAWQLFLADLDPMLIAFIVFSWMPYARLTNSVVLRTRQEDYILAARSLGMSHLRLIFRHLIPNSISPGIVMAARDVGYLVLLQAGFTFIGLSNRSEWGVLLSLGRNYVIGPGGNPFTWWWIYLPTTLAIVLFGVGWNLLGDGLNDWLDPYQSRARYA